MMSKPFAFMVVAAGCIVAAGVGAYVATSRLSGNSSAPTEISRDAAPASADVAVIETEGGVSPAVSLTASSDASPSATSPEDQSPAGRSTSAAPSESEVSRTTDAARAPKAASQPRPAPVASRRPQAPSRPASERPAVTPPSRTDQEPESVGANPAVEPVQERARAEVDFPAWPAAPESRPAPREPEPTFEELVVPADSVIGIQIERTISSESAQIEDRVDARVTRDVRSDGVVAIPAGSKVQGSVTQVDQGGKVRGRARLGVRFHTLVLADGTRTPIRTETIYREGESPAGESSAKIGGGAVGGAILGAILGGRKGAAVGGSIGAAGGTAAVMAGGRNAAVLQAGSTVTVRLSDPVTMTVDTTP